ncbi:MAG: asparagine synthase (glutamine-hydrolyzing) [Gammaproteobacteria bacterium]|nr:MAG: asparagine synthase (glutamine-hydrolyzing) [Gammaproteobacteria bacterium]
MKWTLSPLVTPAAARARARRAVRIVPRAGNRPGWSGRSSFPAPRTATDRQPKVVSARSAAGPRGAGARGRSPSGSGAGAWARAGPASTGRRGGQRSGCAAPGSSAISAAAAARVRRPGSWRYTAVAGLAVEHKGKAGRAQPHSPDSLMPVTVIGPRGGRSARPRGLTDRCAGRRLGPMCGIAGYWSVAPVEPETLAVFTDLLAHRGPDGSGYLTADGGRLGLGHRRLSILDPDERSRQPMLSNDGRHAIVFNGEIYNFLEIRAELQARGHAFHTESDTEVILRAYAEWGAACQDRFNGMWAFVIWDNVARQLFFSRDRFGVKPLLVMATSRGIAFASEAKAFAALSWAAGITAIRAGTCATITGPTAPLEVSRWWQPLDHIHAVSASYPEQVARFRELFRDACRLRLRSDVPVGTAISGGMDSSAVLAMVNALGVESVARRPCDWSRAFTVVAPGTEHDELEYATAACKAADVEPVVVDLFRRCNPDDIDEYLYLTDGMPLTNLSAWYLYRSMQQQGIRVSMDGQGADEILAGYYWDAMRTLRLEGSWLRRPRRTLDLVRTISAMTRGSPYIRIGAKELLTNSSTSLRRIAGRISRRQSREPLLFGQGHDAECREMTRQLPPLNSILFMAVNDSIQNLLQRYDLLSMSSGLEIRMPFLDWRLVSYTLSLPAESILGNGFTKRILRDAMAPYLPPKILRRKRKLQFQGPVRELLRGPLRSWIESFPDLGAAAAEVLATGTYGQVRDLGDRLVTKWNQQTGQRLASARIAALQKRHRADPEALHRRMRWMALPEGFEPSYQP